MINQGLINIDYTNYNKLRFTPLSNAVLFEGLMVNLSELIFVNNDKAKPQTTDLSSKTTKKKKQIIQYEIDDADKSLFERLEVGDFKKQRKQVLLRSSYFPIARLKIYVLYCPLHWRN